MIQTLLLLKSLFKVALIFSKLYVLHGGKSGLDDITDSQRIVMKCTDDSSCPTWNYCSSGSCQCGEKHQDIILCNGDSNFTAVLDCNYVTFDEDTGSTFVGTCFYNCMNNKINGDVIYHALPKEPNKLVNSSVCRRFNRKGLLCGECENGFSPFVLSYNLSCVKCPDGHKNWWKFFMIGFVPLTFFCLLIIVLNINVTSSGLHGVVWFSQTFSVPALMRLVMAQVEYSKHALMAVKIFVPFYSFWNLELFRSIIPDTCLNVNPLQALALEYLVALYPLILLFLSYCMILVYDTKFLPITIIWTPFRKFFTLFHHNWNIHTSVIDSFSTVYLLSYIKVLSVSMDLLIPTTIYKLNSDDVLYGLYYLPSVQYFGRHHFLYAMLALIVLIIFVGIPTMVLVLYPLRFFQKVLTYFSINWHFIHVFVDSFQGCYKDGTEPGTFDCRWFSVLMLLTRPLLFIVYALTLSTMFFSYALVFIVTVLIILINIQPYKKTAVRYPSTDSTFIVFLSISYSAILGLDTSSITNHTYGLIFIVICLVSACVPLFYIAFYILSWLIKAKRKTKQSS